MPDLRGEVLEIDGTTPSVCSFGTKVFMITPSVLLVKNLRARASVALDEQKFASKGNVAGRLVLESDKDFRVDKVGLAVQITEILWPIWTEVEPPKKVLYSKMLVISGPSRVARGSKNEFPFEIKASARPTAHLSVLVVDMQGTVAVKSRRDIVCEKRESFMSEGAWTLLKNVKRELAHGFPLSNIRVVVKETIKIPCGYCGTLMPIEASRCTYCRGKLSK